MSQTNSQTAEYNGFGLSARMESALLNLSPQMARIAQTLLANPSLPLELSIKQLAERAGVSPAALTRFAQALGYSGYPALRVAAAADHGRSTAHEAWEAQMPQEIGADTAPRDLINTLLSAQVSALQTAADLLDPAKLSELADAICRARQIDIYGIGGSGVSGTRMALSLYAIGLNARCWSEVELGLGSAALLDQDCVAIGISVSGRTGDTLAMTQAAAARGVFTAAITSYPTSPLARAADTVIHTCPPGLRIRPSALASEQGQTFALNALHLMVAQRQYSRSRQAAEATAEAVASHRRLAALLAGAGPDQTDHP
ncbi:MAG: MurR/RpiR family transcriptional regulator [Bifidobacteriaceae bacterium]|jgi:DNA-binding MurR/RpiR family transcriptional regulator|nr:MurR/RpiR family transcriptional regulator [Bifidobacteriaceae bacterium]